MEICLRACVYVCMSAWMNVCMNVYQYGRRCVLMYVCIDGYIGWPIQQVDRIDGLRYLKESVNTYIGRWYIRTCWIAEKIVCREDKLSRHNGKFYCVNYDVKNWKVLEMFGTYFINIKSWTSVVHDVIEKHFIFASTSPCWSFNSSYYFLYKNFIVITVFICSKFEFAVLHSWTTSHEIIQQNIIIAKNTVT